MLRERPNERLDMGWKLSARVEISSETFDLGGGWHFTSEEEPEKTLRERLASRDGAWELGLEFRDGEATEADALLGIE